MKRSRLAVVTLCVFATAGLMGGCGTNTQGSGTSAATSSSASPSPSVAAPKDVLLASAKAVDETPFDFQVKQTGTSGQGSIDPLKKAALINISGKVSGQSIAMGFTVIGSEFWLKIDLGTALNKQFGIDKSKWMAIDQSKIKDKTTLPLDAAGGASIGMTELFSGVVSAQRTDNTHFTGTIDLAKDNAFFSPDKDVLAKVGDKAKAVPFTATLDSKGRLTQIKTDGTGIDPGLSIDVTISNYGAAKAVAKPTNVIPAPAFVYTIFGG